MNTNRGNSNYIVDLIIFEEYNGIENEDFTLIGGF